MANKTFAVTEIVGTSDKSIEDAIKGGLATATATLRNLAWFEVLHIRGSIREGQVADFQVTLKVGFRYER